MRVVLVAVGDTTRASSRFRVHNWAGHLARRGVRHGIVVKELRNSSKSGQILRFIPQVLRAHLGLALRLVRSFVEIRPQVVVLQEVLLPTVAVRALKALGFGVVFDCSDPLFHPGYYAGWAAPRLQKRNEKRFFALVRLADAVVLENENLAALIRPLARRTEVMGGPINHKEFRPAPDRRLQRDHIKIGWTGSPATSGYLEYPLRALKSCVDSGLASFEVVLIGAPKDLETHGLDNVDIRTWDPATEAHDVAEFDIGIFSIPTTDYAHYRGGGKLFVYLASGVPIVATDWGIGRQVVRDSAAGIVTPATPDGWFEAFASILRRPADLAPMSERARELGVAEYSYDAYSELYLEILRDSASR